MKDLFEFIPYVPLLYKNRGRILQNEKWAGAIIPNASMDEEERHLGGMIDVWNNGRFYTTCNNDFVGSSLLEPYKRLCTERDVVVDVAYNKADNGKESWWLAVCTKCAKRHKQRHIEDVEPYYQYGEVFDATCRKHKCANPANIEEVINTLVAETMRYKLSVMALYSILPKEQAETVALYAVRGQMQKSDMAYSIRLIAERFMQSNDAFESAILKNAFFYYASELYKKPSEYRIAEHLFEADSFERQLNAVILYHPTNLDEKQIASLDGVTATERLQYCTELAKKGYAPHLLSAVCLAEYENLLNL